jgi:CRISPR-associated protein Csx17
MSSETYTHRLLGCSSIPLSNYLKAIGVLRIVSEQADSQARGWWSGDVFHLETILSEEMLLSFFLEQYQPTPIVVPWSGSDFFESSCDAQPKDFHARWPENRQRYCPTANLIIEAILVTDSLRLSEYRTVIKSVFSVMKNAKISLKSEIEGPKGEPMKRLLLTELRNTLPDKMVQWIDSAVVIDTDSFVFNSLLGSGGGSDGNSHFSDNFMQSVWICFKDFEWQRKGPIYAAGGIFSTDDAIKTSIFGGFSINTLISGRSPGLFSSQDVGGPNSTAGFEANASFNPWNYIFLLEGAMVFSGTLAKRAGFHNSTDASFPFSTRLSSAGAGSLIASENSGREMWLPQWSTPIQYKELHSFISEGRMSLGSRYASTGLDAARAVGLFGIDRGIKQFQRIGIVRGRVGGDNYNSAIDLGKWAPTPQPQVELLHDIDSWLDSFRRAAASENAPSQARRALRRLETSIFELCKHPGPLSLQVVLSSLGEAESVLATSTKWRTESNVRPFPTLSVDWLNQSDDGSAEFRLAASVAAIYTPEIGNMRQHLVPVDSSGRWPAWIEIGPDILNVVWTAGSLESNLIAVIQRRNILAQRQGNRSTGGTLVFPGNSRSYATLRDIQAFIQSKVQDERIASLVRGLVLIDWRNVLPNRNPNEDPQSIDLKPDALYSILKLCHSPHPIRGNDVSLEPAILRLAIANRLGDATQLAARRLLASNLPPSIRMATRQGANSRRIVAATLFPITWLDTQKVAMQVLKPESTNV